jgi:hypothetical protein
VYLQIAAHDAVSFDHDFKFRTIRGGVAVSIQFSCLAPNATASLTGRPWPQRTSWPQRAQHPLNSLGDPTGVNREGEEAQ